MIVFRLICCLLGCALVLMGSGCYTAGPRPAKDGYTQTPIASGSETVGMPLVDPNFRLAPNDVIGVTYISRDTPEGYKLQTGDTLLIEYHQQEYLNRNVVVRPDQKITLPYIGEIDTVDTTVAQLAKKIADRYREENIFGSLTTTVSLLTFNARLKELQSLNANTAAGQTREVMVGADGAIELPLGVRVDVAGKSMRQCGEEIRNAYAGILNGVEVHTELRQIRTNFIYVVGEVNASGLHAIPGPMGVAQAISVAGGFRTTADLSSVVVLRANADCDAPIGRLVDVDKILGSGDLSQDLMVRRFDVVYVPPSKIKKLNDAVLLYIRNTLPVETYGNVGFSYMWGNTSGTRSGFRPF